MRLHEASGVLGTDALQKIDREFQLLADWSADSPIAACAGKKAGKCSTKDSVFTVQAGLQQDQVEGGAVSALAAQDDVIGDEAVEWRSNKPVAKKAGLHRAKAKRRK